MGARDLTAILIATRTVRHTIVRARCHLGDPILPLHVRIETKARTVMKGLTTWTYKKLVVYVPD